MKICTDNDITQAFTKLSNHLAKRGLRPRLQKLDNEASAALQASITAQKINFQLVLPHTHWRNAAERTIHMFKNNFVAGLCSTNVNFLLYLWCRLLPQATTTLNLLRLSQLNPRISAKDQPTGAFDFNQTPLPPPCIR